VKRKTLHVIRALIFLLLLLLFYTYIYMESVTICYIKKYAIYVCNYYIYIYAFGFYPK